MTSGYVLHLAGGPCAGVYETRHAGCSLLAVRDIEGTTDVLDAPGDEPGLLEDTFRYVEHGPRSTMFLDGDRSATGIWVTVTYRYAGPVDWRGGRELRPIAHAESLRLMRDWQAGETRLLRALTRPDHLRLVEPERDPPKPPTEAAARRALSAPVVQRSLF